jgi:hypothetical protein
MGKFVFTDQAKLKVLSTIPKEYLADISSGDLSPFDVLRNIRYKPTGKMPKLKLVKYSGVVEKIALGCQQINNGRRVRGRKAALVTRPLHFSERMESKNKFFATLLGAEIGPESELHNYLRFLPNKPDMQIVLTKPRYSDSRPVKMGSVVASKEDIEYKFVFVKRSTGLTFGRHLNSKEQMLSAMPKDEFKGEYFLYQTINSYSGLRFKSPGGKPLVRFLEGDPLTQSFSFNFNLDLPDATNTKIPFTIRGERYDNFQPAFIGGYTIKQATESKNRLAFGYAVIGPRIHAFYQALPGRPKVYILDVIQGKYVYKFRAGQNMYVLYLKKDITPILLDQTDIEYITNFQPNFGGDPTGIINYGNFLNTSSRYATKVMRGIFNKLGCNFPNNLGYYKPNYPHFLDKCIELKSGKVNILSGARSATKLKLIYDANGPLRRVFDLSADVPVDCTKDCVPTPLDPMWE